MAAATTSRVMIELEVRSEPIRGLLQVARSQRVRFVGWSELAELLEEARTGSHPQRRQPDREEEKRG